MRFLSIVKIPRKSGFEYYRIKRVVRSGEVLRRHEPVRHVINHYESPEHFQMGVYINAHYREIADFDLVLQIKLSCRGHIGISVISSVIAAIHTDFKGKKFLEKFPLEI